MHNSPEFLKLILDSVTEHIVVIDGQGMILFVNRSWASFGQENDCLLSDSWTKTNYIEACEKAAQMGDEFGERASTGIKQVMVGEVDSFYLEYPCHSPEEKRWFTMRVTPFQLEGRHCYVISHQDITERKLAEEEVRSLAARDGLTNVANRRAFDEFLSQEWRRCARLGLSISLAIIDIDYFKLLNDRYGHQIGDECLVTIAKHLQKFAKRPSDLCARYGGEEFALVWGGVSLEQSQELAEELRQGIEALAIPNESSPTSPFVTASIGLASMVPIPEDQESKIISEADHLLYQAKESGRNKLIYE